jgi:3-hydroxypropanoate dehydrogenase
MRASVPPNEETHCSIVSAPISFTHNTKLDGKALDQLFRMARAHNGWRAINVPDSMLEEAVELAKMGPTSANASPLRVVFVRSPEAKSLLKAALMPAASIRP